MVATNNKTKTKIIPQLVSPAGDLLRFKIACIYGADNVYFSGQKYGLRAAASNLCNEEIIEAVKFGKKYKVKPLITVNAIMHDKDLDGIVEYIKFLDKAGAYACIIADPGLISLIKENSKLKVHISTQTSLLNSYTAKLYKTMGVDRIVLAREISLKESQEIKNQSSLETEVFGHGAMCMSYSGKCALSTYLSKRDANRGGCIQACRFSYESNNKVFSCKHPFSSKDLCGINLIDKYFENEVSAIKIEGRMKSPFYVAITTKCYRLAIDWQKENKFNEKRKKALKEYLNLIPHRDYFEGSLKSLASKSSIYPDNTPTTQNAKGEFVGIVEGVTKDYIIIKNYKAQKRGDEIYFLNPKDIKDVKIKLNKILSIKKEKLEEIRQEQVFLIPRTKTLMDVCQYGVLYCKG